MIKKEAWFNIDTILPLISIAMAGVFIYEKYFVAETELQKIDYGITAMLWILLGLILYTLTNTQKLIREVAKAKIQS